MPTSGGSWPSRSDGTDRSGPRRREPVPVFPPRRHGGPCPARRLARSPPGRDRRAGRTVGKRQVHAPQLRGRTRRTGGRVGDDRGSRSDASARGRTRRHSDPGGRDRDAVGEPVRSLEPRRQCQTAGAAGRPQRRALGRRTARVRRPEGPRHGAARHIVGRGTGAGGARGGARGRPAAPHRRRAHGRGRRGHGTRHPRCHRPAADAGRGSPDRDPQHRADGGPRGCWQCATAGSNREDRSSEQAARPAAGRPRGRRRRTRAPRMPRCCSKRPRSSAAIATAGRPSTRSPQRPSASAPATGSPSWVRRAAARPPCCA